VGESVTRKRPRDWSGRHWPAPPGAASQATTRLRPGVAVSGTVTWTDMTPPGVALVVAIWSASSSEFHRMETRPSGVKPEAVRVITVPIGPESGDTMSGPGAATTGTVRNPRAIQVRSATDHPRIRSEGLATIP